MKQVLVILIGIPIIGGLIISAAAVSLAIGGTAFIGVNLAGFILAKSKGRH